MVSLVRTGHTTSYRPCTTMVGIWRLRIAQSHSITRARCKRGPHILSISCESSNWPSRMKASLTK